MPDQIQRYRDSVNIPPGTDWCVAFVYWCHEQASWLMGRSSNPMKKTASTGILFNFAKQHGLFVDSPEPGDIYINGKKSHTGIIAKANPGMQNDKTHTIEGNTWTGDHLWGVHKRQKKFTNAYFIRL